MSWINLVSEDLLGESIARKIIQKYAPNYQPHSINKTGGKSAILKRLLEYNRLAKHLKFFILLDLDQEQCIVHFIKKCFKNKLLKENLIFRVAVLEIESWILADSKGFSEYFKVPKEKLHDNPDKLKDPKRFLVNIIKKCCKEKSYRESIIPDKNSGAVVGPAYNSAMIQFIEKKWSPKRAINVSTSLKRCIQAVKNI